MRRALSIVLVLFFGLGPLSVLAGASEDDTSLPACCRRLGAHHCAMSSVASAMTASSAPSFSAPVTCPRYPGAAAAVVSPAFALTAAQNALPAMMAQAYKAAGAYAAAPSSPSRTRAGRGPPSRI
jgi:hypothetical protein